MARESQALTRIQLGERKRRYPAHFASKLTDSDGFRLVERPYSSERENAETQHWLKTALACGYIDRTVHDSLVDKSETIGSKLGRMITDFEIWKPRN